MRKHLFDAHRPVVSRLATGFALLLVLSSIAPLASRAEEPANDAIPVNGFTYTAPIRNMLSSAAWAVVSGYDPRVNNLAAERGIDSGIDPSAYMAAGRGGNFGAGGLNQAVPFRNPAPAFSRNLIVTKQVGLFPIQTEPHIVVDPDDPDHLVMGTIDYNFPGMSTYTSFDGGETWDGPNQVRYFREDVTSAGDPVLAFDRDGNVYMTSISLGFEEFRIGTIASFAEVSSMVVAKSADGGLTWTDPVSASRAIISTVSNVDSAGKERGTITMPFLDKPWITVGPSAKDPSKDVIYLTYTDFETTYGLIYSDEVPYLSTPFTETTIRLVKSEDGGATWSKPVAVSPTVLQAAGQSEPGEGEGESSIDSSGTNAAPANGGALTSASSSGAAIRGHIAALDVFGPRHILTSGEIRDAIGDSRQFARLQEDPDYQAQQPSADQQESNRTVQGSQPKVLSDGTVVVAYLDTTNDGIQEGLFTIQIALSTDNGETFAPSVTAGLLREPHFRPRSSTFRYWGTAFPQMTVGPDKEIYVATTGLPMDKPTDDGDIYLLRSLDGGKTWKEPLRLNTDKTSRPQFYPSLGVSPDGVLHAMWGDMRDDPEEVRYNIYYSKSSDQGTTWGFSIPDQNFTAPDTRVTDFASNSLRGFPGGQFIGDYFSIAPTDGEVYMVWADCRLGEFGGPNQQIAFAREEAIKPASLFLNPPSGTAGRVVDIQGFGFQAISNIQLLVSGVIVANPRTDEKGQFQTSIYMPLTGEGPTNITAFDETGNVATSAFYTEFGFDSLQQSLDAINQQLGLPNQGGPQQPGTPAANPAATPAAPAAGTPVASPSPSS